MQIAPIPYFTSAGIVIPDSSQKLENALPMGKEDIPLPNGANPLQGLLTLAIPPLQDPHGTTPTLAGQLSIPKDFGKYRAYYEDLGIGRHGFIKLGTDEEGKPITIKTFFQLRNTDTEKAKIRRAFSQEKRNIERLQNENIFSGIASAEGADASGKTDYCLAMPLANGISIREAINIIRRLEAKDTADASNNFKEDNQRIAYLDDFILTLPPEEQSTLKEALRDQIIKGLLGPTEGIEYLEGECLVHRDIKASNIMFNSNESGIRGVIVDTELCTRFYSCTFSERDLLTYSSDVTSSTFYDGIRPPSHLGNVARRLFFGENYFPDYVRHWLGKETKRRGFCGIEGSLGTHIYSTPERLRGGIVDSSSDLWGIASTIYQTYAGSTPFEGADKYQTLRNIRTGENYAPLVDPHAKEHGLAELVNKQLSHARRNRFRTTDQFRRHLEDSINSLNS